MHMSGGEFNLKTHVQHGKYCMIVYRRNKSGKRSRMMFRKIGFYFVGILMMTALMVPPNTYAHCDTMDGRLFRTHKRLWNVLMSLRC